MAVADSGGRSLGSGAPQEGEVLPASSCHGGRETPGRWGREREPVPGKNPGPRKQLVLAPMAGKGGSGLDL